MSAVIDEAARNVTAALKAGGLWDSTLLVFSSDNGGPNGGGTYVDVNVPLRGYVCHHLGASPSLDQQNSLLRLSQSMACHPCYASAESATLTLSCAAPRPCTWPVQKLSEWDGAYRVYAFVSGGLLPEPMRGASTGALVALCDWYATLCGLAGIGDVCRCFGARSLDPTGRSTRCSLSSSLPQPRPMPRGPIRSSILTRSRGVPRWNSGVRVRRGRGGGWVLRR